jgi:pSer/pThr/pTyr-binding forkhead associated (FHA) protein
MFRLFKKEKQAILVSNSNAEYVLNLRAPNKIGRSHSSNIVVNDDLGVSRENSVVTYDKQTQIYSIEDIGSRHGTHVNGERITEKKELKSDDIISMGKYTRFTFKIR